jgi:hypothetical protein
MMKPKKAFGSGWKPGLVTCAFLYGVASHENPVHEICINFAGSVIGWAAGFLLIFHREKVETLPDVFLLIAGMAGIFGFLLYILSKFTLK